MNVLMTGVDKNRLGGMWTVANNYITSVEYNKNVNLKYIATSTNGSIVKRIFVMLMAFFKIIFILLKNKTDIVHIHMAEKGSTFRAMMITKIAKHTNTKVIIHLHAGPFIDWYSTLNKNKKLKIRKMFEQSDCILVLGDYWKKKLVELVDESKIHVLYNGVNIPSNNNYNSSAKYVTFMGVLKKEKGIFDLIDAIEKIDNQLDKRIKIMICGIDLTGKVQNYINEKKLENRFKLVGWVNEEEKEKIYNNTVLNVLPSYFEALSMTVIESMAHGIPIITTNISTMYEVLNDKKLLVNPGDVNTLSKKIIDLLNNKKGLEEISEKIFDRAKNKFNVTTNVRETINIYKKII